MLHSKISKHTVITQKSYFSWAVTAPVALFKWIKHLFFKENIFDSCWKTKQHLSSARMSQRRRTLVLKKKERDSKGRYLVFFSQLFNEKLTEPDRKKENLTASYKQVMGSNPSCPSA